jgi:hypothetical protein
MEFRLLCLGHRSQLRRKFGALARQRRPDVQLIGLRTRLATGGKVILPHLISFMENHYRDNEWQCRMTVLLSARRASSLSRKFAGERR